MDEDEIRRRVAAARVGRLATVGADGRPHLVPICFVLLGDTVYSAVDHKPKRTTRLRRLANVGATGVASLLVDHYEEDWGALWWARLDGDAHELSSMDAAVDALCAKYPQYAARRPVGPVLALTVTRWSGWRSR